MQAGIKEDTSTGSKIVSTSTICGASGDGGHKSTEYAYASISIQTLIKILK